MDTPTEGMKDEAEDLVEALAGDLRLNGSTLPDNVRERFTTHLLDLLVKNRRDGWYDHSRAYHG